MTYFKDLVAAAQKEAPPETQNKIKAQATEIPCAIVQ